MTYESIALLCPSRGRPAMARTFIESVHDTTGCAMAALAVDRDEAPNIRGAYKSIENDMPGVCCAMLGAPTVSQSWNMMAYQDYQDILMMTNDDLVCRTPGWDRIVLNILNAEFPDGIFVAWVDDGFKHGDHCAFPIVSRKWVETLGYFAPPYFEFGLNDTWIMDLGRRVGRLRYIPEVTIEHMHFTREGGYDRDDTTERNRRDGQAARDRERYDLLEPIRKLDAEKLRKVME